MTLLTLIEKLAELEGKATPGEWGVHDNHSGHLFRDIEIDVRGGILFRSTSYGRMAEDGILIAEARNALPQLLEVVKVMGHALEIYAKCKCGVDHSGVSEEAYIAAGCPGCTCSYLIARSALSRCEQIVRGK